MIEVGQIHEGISILERLVDINFKDNITLVGATYLAYGYHLIDILKKRDRYLNFVVSNQSLLDKDEEILFQKVKNIIKS